MENCRDTYLGVYTKRAKELLHDATLASRELKYQFQQNGAGEVYYHEMAEWRMNEDERFDLCFYKPADLKAKIIRRLKWHLRTCRDLTTSSGTPGWRASLNAAIADLPVLIDRLSGMCYSDLEQLHGREKTKAVVGQELDPIKAACIDKLYERIDVAKETAQNEIDEFTRTRNEKLAAEVDRLLEEIKKLQNEEVEDAAE